MASDFIKQGPYHTITNGKLKDKNPVGYCWCELHKGYLLTSHLRKHHCIAKKCVWFQKNEKHPFFQSNTFDKKKRDIFCKLKGWYYDGRIDCRTYHDLESKLRNVSNEKQLNAFITIYMKGEYYESNLSKLQS